MVSFDLVRNGTTTKMSTIAKAFDRDNLERAWRWIGDSGRFGTRRLGDSGRFGEIRDRRFGTGDSGQTK
jgi:hypothetical protein